MTQACSFKNKGGGCNDNNPCTYSDRCTAGKCGGTTRSCNDGNHCTLDTCDPKDGKCKHAAGPDGTVCTDGNSCTHTDRCAKGKCVGKNKTCNDGNVCTVESCNKSTGLCQFAPAKEGTKCSDNSKCTVNETCKGGTCSVSQPKNCDDKNACTTDSCNPNNGNCRHQAIFGCGGNCKQDSHCKQDNNACTKNSCNKTTSKCENKIVDAPCSDNNKCTSGDKCILSGVNAGKCGGTAKNCGDKQPCTNDWCQASSGNCMHANRPNGAGCNDGDPCTYTDQCDGGVCGGTNKNCDDSNSCTLDTCDPANGSCKHAAIPGCGGNCSKNSHCKQDSNPCRSNVCDLALKKCISKNNNAACGDGNPCTIKDRCDVRLLRHQGRPVQSQGDRRLQAVQERAAVQRQQALYAGRLPGRQVHQHRHPQLQAVQDLQGLRRRHHLHLGQLHRRQVHLHQQPGVQAVQAGQRLQRQEPVHQRHLLLGWFLREPAGGRVCALHRRQGLQRRQQVHDRQVHGQ